MTPDRFEIVGKDGNGLIAGIIFEDRYRENDKYYTKQEYHRFLMQRSIMEMVITRV